MGVHMKKRILVLAMGALLALMGIVLATSTMNPKITYTGNGIPDPSVGRVGDMYIDLDTNILYVMGTDGWGVFAVLPAPVNGTNGLNGATWIVGDTEPASEIGSNGDLYFNYATLDIYYKTNDVWTYLANIQGQTGPQGPQGETGPAGQDGINGTNGIDGTNGTDGRNGSIWYNELVANLTDDLGYDGDYYMFTNGTVYYKMNGTWVYFTSLMGPTGPQGETGGTGPQGPAGTDGINGTDGTSGLNGQDGTTGATGATGATGPRGLAGADASVPWWLYVVAAGCVGASCYSVYKSRKKNEGNK